MKNTAQDSENLTGIEIIIEPLRAGEYNTREYASGILPVVFYAVVLRFR